MAKTVISTALRGLLLGLLFSPLASQAPRQQANVELAQTPRVTPTPGLNLSQPAIELPPPSLRPSQDQEAEQELRKVFSTGDYEVALALSERQERSDLLTEDYKKWLASQKPNLLLGKAWQWIQLKRCSEATAILEQLLQTNPMPLAWKGLAHCQLLQRDYYAAKANLEKALELNREDPDLYLLMAEVKESTGEIQEALTLAEEARLLTERQQGEEEATSLKAKELSYRQKAEEASQQIEVQTGTFRIRYQVGVHDRLAQASTFVVQQTAESLSQHFGFTLPLEPIELIFHPSAKFNTITHGPEWSTGQYDGRIRIPVFPDSEPGEPFFRILRHEIAHALLSEHAGHRRLPHWFQEGFAQVAECPELCWNFRFSATSQSFLSMSLFAEDFTKLNRRQAQLVYKQSFYLFLVLRYRFYGLAGIKQILDHLPHLSAGDSDEILGQVGLKFQDLHARSQESWSKALNF